MQTTIFEKTCSKAENMILDYIKKHGSITPVCLSDKERYDFGFTYSNETIGRCCRKLRRSFVLYSKKVKRNGVGRPFTIYYLNNERN